MINTDAWKPMAFDALQGGGRAATLIMLLLLLLSTAIACGGESLKQKLAKRSLWLHSTPQAQTLPQALAALSADYQTHYHEPLRIYIAVDLAQPPGPKEPQAPPSKVLGPEPLPDPDPASARIDLVPLHASVANLLRLLTNLGGVTYTVRDDIILIHAKTK